MIAYINGVGAWFPDGVRENSRWDEQFVTVGHKRGERSLNDVRLSEDRRSADIVRPHLHVELDPFLGATRRYEGADGETAIDAGTRAAEAALDDAGIPADRVTHVIGYDIVPDHVGPASATAVAFAIGAHGAQAFNIDSACATGITSMELGAGLLRTDPSNVILCIQSHMVLRVMPLLHPATPGLGDGSTAFVMTSDPVGGIRVRSAFGVTHGQYHRSVIWRRGNGPDMDAPWYLAGGAYRMGTYDIDGVKYLQAETVSFAAKTVAEAARRANVSVGHIDALVSVQPRGYIPGCIAERLDLPRNTAVETYDAVAHIGACGPVYNLLVARDRGLLHPGTVVAMYGQGAGFTRSAAILEVSGRR